MNPIAFTEVAAAARSAVLGAHATDPVLVVNGTGKTERCDSADRAGQQLDRVEHREGAAEPLGVRGDLQGAAGIARCHCLGARVEEVACLALPELGCWLGLDQVVDTG